VEEFNHLGIVGSGSNGKQLATLAEADGYVVHRLGFEDERALAGGLEDLPFRLGALCICAPGPPGLIRVVAEHLRLSEEKRPACLLNMTPVGPVHVRRVDALIDRLDPSLLFAEAAFSGGAKALRERKATLFYGSRFGPPDVPLERLLHALAARVLEFGSVAEASAAKLVSDVALTLFGLGASEALGIGRKSGLDEEALAKVLCPAALGSLGRLAAPAEASRLPRILSREESRIIIRHVSEKNLGTEIVNLLVADDHPTPTGQS
jgi:3-hydroxyisobutyrate dehydrogenase-like beta-hydroxyacid dehydrogenase